MTPKRLNPVASMAGILLISSLFLFSSCSKSKSRGGGSTTDSLITTGTNPPTLLDYKSSNHHIFVGYLVGDGNDPSAGFNPVNAPDSADFLEFFAGSDTSTADWRATQAKGTRIVVCHFVNNAYFDGSAKDPATQVPGYVNPPGFSQTVANNTSSYNHWARDIYNAEILGKGLDGIDLDVEYGTFGNDVPRNVANADSLAVALARYYGPNCTLCTVKTGGKKPVFFFDTDGTSGMDNKMYLGHPGNYDYVLFQSYTTGAHGWNGDGVNGLQAIANEYGIDKAIYLVNGDSFIYPNGTEDQAGGDAQATADLYAYANWVVQNKGAGVGVYRMSRDYNHKPPFSVSRTAIQLMNPAH